MQWRNTNQSFGGVAKGFHWLMAVLVIGLLGVGLYMTDLKPSPLMFKTYALHKSIGIVVLTLAFLRLVWRLTNPRPDPLPSHHLWERGLALATHGFLYLTLFAMPLSGWLMSSAKGYAVSVFGLFTLPDLIGVNKEMAGLLAEAHEIWAYGLMGVIGLHVAGALKHHVIDRDATLRRMLPALALIFVLPATAHAAPPVWTIDRADSRLEFSGTQMGASFQGRFKDFDGTIRFSPDDLAGSHVRIVIKTASAETGSPDRDSYIVTPDWLSAEAFPDAVFETTSIEPGDKPDTYIAKARLTIRDKTQDVVLPFTVTYSDLPAGGRRAVVQGELDLKRKDFGVGQGEWGESDTVGPVVTVKVDLTATAM